MPPNNRQLAMLRIIGYKNLAPSIYYHEKDNPVLFWNSTDNEFYIGIKDKNVSEEQEKFEEKLLKTLNQLWNQTKNN